MSYVVITIVSIVAAISVTVVAAIAILASDVVARQGVEFFLLSFLWPSIFWWGFLRQYTCSL